MIISLKDHFNHLFKAVKAPERFTIIQDGITVVPQGLKSLTYNIPTSRFSGISVKVTGLNSDDEIYVRMFGMSQLPPEGLSQRQFESKFTGSDNEDLFQGWTYRDFTDKRKLYVQLFSNSALPVTIGLQIIGETL